MSADYSISTEHQAVFSMGWGTLTFADIVNHRALLWKDPAYSADFRQIADLSGVSKMELSPDEIAALAKQPVLAHRSRRAIVVASSLQYGLAHIFLAYSDKQTVELFRGLDEAAQWVELPLEVAAKSFAALRAKHGLV